MKNEQEFLPEYSEEEKIEHFIDQLLNDKEPDPFTLQVESRKITKLVPTNRVTPRPNEKLSARILREAMPIKESICIEVMVCKNGRIVMSGLSSPAAQFYMVNLRGIEGPLVFRKDKLVRLLKDHATDLVREKTSNAIRIYQVAKVDRPLLLDNCE